MSRTIILTIKDNAVAEEFARALLANAGNEDFQEVVVPLGTTLDALIARPTLGCRCSSGQRGKIKNRWEWSRAPRYGWFVHTTCRRPAQMVVRRFIYNMLGGYNNLLDELREPEPKEPFQETHYDVPALKSVQALGPADATATAESGSEPGKFYHLELRDGKWSCDCTGYYYHQTCKHADQQSIYRHVLGL
jgi:hypothetical protein